MLTNLFWLDGTPRILELGETLPAMLPDDTVSDVVFAHGRWPAPSGKIRKVSFHNVSFSKVTVTKVTFTDCRFEDCLFSGTRFRDVEFHNCTFQNCTIWKARFDRVYLDPRSILFGEKYRIEAANVGISVFQALLTNFEGERQDQFYIIADIFFRRWQRYQIWHELRRKRMHPLTARGKWLASWARDFFAGFGYRPGRFFLTTIFLFLLISCVNYFFIGNAVEVNGIKPDHATFTDVVFYSFSILTVLGFSSVVPMYAFAKLLTVFETLLAIGWLGLFTSMLVKRFLR